MPVEWINYKGCQILYCDYRNMKNDDELLENLKKEAEIYEKTQSKILCLNDYRDAVLSKVFMDKITEVGKLNKGKTLKAAILGITGLKKILLIGYSKITGEAIKPFDDEISAKEYLIK
jgi:hypothetical protein